MKQRSRGNEHDLKQLTRKETEKERKEEKITTPGKNKALSLVPFFALKVDPILEEFRSLGESRWLIGETLAYWSSGPELRLRRKS